MSLIVESDLKEILAKLEQRLDSIEKEIKNTQTQIADLRQEVHKEITDLRQDFQKEIQTVRQEISDLRQDFQKEITNLRQDFQKEIQNVQTQIADLRLTQAEIKGEIKHSDTRWELVQSSIQAIPNLAEKVGELKNWRQIAVIGFTTTIGIVVGWFIKGGRL